MKSDVPLDYAVFQLSPRLSRCELFVSYDGTTEKLASGLVKPFVTHLKVAEEQVALSVKSIKLEVERYKNAETWFTKGTLERFVRFVSTPEVLEMVNTFDAEMSQLEAARSIYSQGADDHQSSASGADGGGATAASDATKKELLRAIDIRLAAVKQDLTTACTHASAAGFGPESVLELQLFADHFGAHRLSEACSKFIELSHRRPELFNTNNLTWKSSSDRALRSSTSSDMSLDSPSTDLPKSSTSKVPFPLRRFSREPSPSPNPMDESEEGENRKDREKDKALGPTTTSTDTSTAESDPSTQSSQRPQLTRRLSVQERISLFESKQKENSPSTATPPSSASAGVKPEPRRLSSGVTSSSDKALLRRWSGVSDMSIDVSGERKEADGNVSTSTPTPNSSSSSNLHIFPPKSKDKADLNGEEGNKDKDRSSEDVVLKEQPPSVGGVRSRAASFGRIEDLGLENQTESVQTQFKSKPWKNEKLGSADQITFQEKAKGPSGGGSRPQMDTGKDFGASNGNQDEAEGDVVSDEVVPRSQFSPTQRRTFKVAVESTASESPLQTVIQNKGGEADFTPEPRLQGKDFESESCSVQIENSGSLKSKFQEYGPRPEQVKTLEVFSSTSVEPMDQVQTVRQSKGNQGLHDELRMKANELEKLFAEHKLRVPADQSNSARRTRPTELPKEQEWSSISRKPVVEASPAQLMMDVDTAACSSNLKFSSTPLMKAADDQDYDITPRHNIYNLSFSDDSRGKSYVKYMQKREAKLREDWSSKGAEKEAKMNAMQDRLEKSRVEMMTKLAGSADKRNSAHDARRRAEKLRSFSARSAMKREQPIDSFVSDEDGDRAEFLGKKLSHTFLGDSSSKSVQSKKVMPNKNSASSTPRNSAAPVPRSSGKASNSATGRRRLNSDNPLAQSVPNFSDLRKENTKPSSGGSRTVRPQGRNNARKKNSNEDLSLVSEEKPRRSQSLRKGNANPMELNDSRNSDGSGNGRSNASVMIEAVRNGHDFDDVSFEPEEMTYVAKEEQDDFETTMGGESADMDNGKERLSQESDKSANSGYENSHTLGFSEAGPASAPGLPTSMPSLFRAMGSIQDSPGESPGSWNSGLQNPFSFHHEISDIDASDSPLGSPASWNFHSLAHTEADAARMRKKWGAAQKPVVGTDSSHSRKEVSKGLKRFLKFGRKNRASESLADWISATTSEGDDDTEDGRDPAYRSSEDLRKSRMGFTHSHHSDDGFNETDLFNEQAPALQSSIPTPPANFKLREEHLSGSSLKAPKSFFSLSNFRSKGSDSKLR